MGYRSFGGSAFLKLFAAPLSNGFGDLGADGVHSVCLSMTPLGVAAPRPGRLFHSAGAFGLRVALI